MKANMGSTDRIVRIVLAAIFVTLYFSGVVTGLVGYGLLVLAGVFLLTSVIRWCPLYAPFGITTCRTQATGDA